MTDFMGNFIGFNRKGKTGGWLATAILLLLAEFCLSLFIGKYPIKLADLQAGDVQAWNV